MKATAAKTTAVRTTKLPSGDVIPILGQGTWHLGEDRNRRASEIAALRLGLDLGLTLIDTAEMYGNGAAEILIGEAISRRRNEAFLVSKVLPQHATLQGTLAACEASLKRMATEWLDLYLLHWRGQVPLAETIEAFERLMASGKIRNWGVSNFDVDDMLEVAALPGGNAVATDQVLYNLAHRGIEFDLLIWCKKFGIPIMAYSPIEQGGLLGHPTLRATAVKHLATPAQIALAWVVRWGDVCAIAQMGKPEHVTENRAALNLRLDAEDLAALDLAFPPPSRKVPLAVH
jgi:diketogulonate reductase-like aldo/keto reductase